jgi:hypothetical protein
MQITKVRILKNLPAALAQHRALVIKYETHGIFKAFETFLYLKEFTTSGKIHNTETSKDAFVSYLAEACNVSRNTMYARLELLKRFELIQVCKLGSIYLESWDNIAQIYNVKPGQYHEIELHEKAPKLEYQLRTLVISEHKARMAYKFANLLRSNNQLRLNLLTYFGKLPETLEQLADMIMQQKVLSFRNWSESFDWWHSIPSDFNAGVDKLMQHFAFKDFRQVAYWKRVLCGCGLITVQTRKHESRSATRKANNVLTGGKVFQHFFYNVKQKVRIWQLPDAINVNF